VTAIHGAVASRHPCLALAADARCASPHRASILRSTLQLVAARGNAEGGVIFRHLAAPPALTTDGGSLLPQPF